MNLKVHPFIYQYKDHVGNVRLSYKQKPNGLLEVVKANDYYPFGMRHNKAKVDAHLYQYHVVGDHRYEVIYGIRRYNNQIGENINSLNHTDKYINQLKK